MLLLSPSQTVLHPSFLVLWGTPRSTRCLLTSPGSRARHLSYWAKAAPSPLSTSVSSPASLSTTSNGVFLKTSEIALAAALCTHSILSLVVIDVQGYHAGEAYSKRLSWVAVYMVRIEPTDHPQSAPLNARRMLLRCSAFLHISSVCLWKTRAGSYFTPSRTGLSTFLSITPLSWIIGFQLLSCMSVVNKVVSHFSAAKVSPHSLLQSHTQVHLPMHVYLRLLLGFVAARYRQVVHIGTDKRIATKSPQEVIEVDHEQHWRQHRSLWQTLSEDSRSTDAVPHFDPPHPVDQPRLNPFGVSARDSHFNHLEEEADLHTVSNALA